MKTVKCVGFVLLQGNRFLVETRELDDDIDPGKMAIPGGHVEGDEGLEKALMRECGEELNIMPTEYKFAYNCLYDAKSELQDCYYYMVTKWSGNLKRKDSGSLRWLPLEQKDMLDIPEDRQAIDAVNALIS